MLNSKNCTFKFGLGVNVDLSNGGSPNMHRTSCHKLKGTSLTSKEIARSMEGTMRAWCFPIWVNIPKYVKKIKIVNQFLSL